MKHIDSDIVVVTLGTLIMILIPIFFMCWVGDESGMPEEVRIKESIENREQIERVKANMTAQEQNREYEADKAEIEIETAAEPEGESEAEYTETELLLRCVEAEAGNQSLEGRRMVADVILNRVDDEDFPDTITDVITKPYEFSSYWDGRMYEVTVSDLTRQAVEMELQCRGYPGLYYFTAEGYSEYGTPWKKVGDHYFSTK